MTRPGDFTPQADAYARARPGYPATLVDRLLARATVRAGDAVAEIGAGTGLFTQLLAQRGLQLTAVEPNAAMRERAPRLEGVTWRAGTFESSGLAAASQRWIVAAQAFHWARPEHALPELRRVLVPGGALTILWNNREVAASDVLRLTRRLIERRVPNFDEGYRNRDWSAVLASTGDFAEPVEDQEHHVVEMTKERYLDLWRSHNLLTAAAGRDALDELVDELGALLADRDRIAVPYCCRAWTARSVL